MSNRESIGGPPQRAVQMLTLLNECGGNSNYYIARHVKPLSKKAVGTRLGGESTQPLSDHGLVSEQDWLRRRCIMRC